MDAPTDAELHALLTPWRDGTTHLVMTTLEFMRRLAAQVPRPRLHLIRFQGVLAPNATAQLLERVFDTETAPFRPQTLKTAGGDVPLYTEVYRERGDRNAEAAAKRSDARAWFGPKGGLDLAKP